MSKKYSSEYILNVIRFIESGGDIAEASAILGISRSQINNWINNHHLNPSQFQSVKDEIVSIELYDRVRRDLARAKVELSIYKSFGEDITRIARSIEGSNEAPRKVKSPYVGGGERLYGID